MSVNGRNKGANFERMIARELHALAVDAPPEEPAEERVGIASPGRGVVDLVDQHLELTPDDPRACILGAVAHAFLKDEERSMALAGRSPGPA